MDKDLDWIEQFRQFDDACCQALNTSEWPRIEDFVSVAPEHHSLRFLLLHTLMEWLGRAGEQQNSLLWPDLKAWFGRPNLKWEMEEQLDLIALEAELHYPTEIPANIIEDQYCDRFCDKEAGLDGRALAARLGATDAGLCPNTLAVLVNPGLPCRRCELVHERFGDYLIGKQIGQGGQGTVHVAYSFAMDHIVALKRLCRFADETPSEWQRRSQFLLREGVKAKVVEHPHAVRAFDCGTIENVPYIAYAMVPGETLKTKLHPVDGRRNKLLSAKEAASKIGNLANAVAIAHTCKVLHLDIKPANVLIDVNQKYFLTDFGLGSFRTHLYCAPEQLSDQPVTVDERADVYSLGLLLYEVTTGQRYEFGGNSNPLTTAKFQALPRDYRAIVETCLQPDPAKRYPSARELSEDLSRFVTHYPVSVRPAGRMRRARMWCRRQPWISATLAMIFVSLFLAAVASLYTLAVFKRYVAIIEVRDLELIEKTAVALIDRAEGSAYPENVQYFSEAIRLFRDNPEIHSARIDGLFRRSLKQLEARIRGAGTISQIFVHPTEIEAARIHPDQGKVVTCSGNQARLWDIGTGKELFTLSHPRKVIDVLFAGAADRVLTVTEGPEFRLWNATELVWHQSFSNLSHVGEPVFLNDGRLVALCHTSDAVALLDMNVEDGQYQLIPCMQGRFKSPKIYASPDHTHIAFQTEGMIHIWNVTATSVRFVQQFPIPAEATCVAFFHQNQAVVVCCVSRQMLAFPMEGAQTQNLPKPYWNLQTLSNAPLTCHLSENDTALIVGTNLGQFWFDPIHGTRHTLADQAGQTWWSSFQHHFVETGQLSVNGRWKLQSRGQNVLVRDLAADQQSVINILQQHWPDRLAVRSDGRAVAGVSSEASDNPLLDSKLSVTSIVGSARSGCCWMGNSTDLAYVTPEGLVQVINAGQSNAASERPDNNSFRIASLAPDCTSNRLAAIIDRETIASSDRSLNWKKITVPRDVDGFNMGIHCASATSSLLLERAILPRDDQPRRRLVKCLDPEGHELWRHWTASLTQQCCGFGEDGQKAWILSSDQKLIIRDLSSNLESTMDLPDPVDYLRLSNNRHFLVLTGRLNPESRSFSVTVVDLVSGGLAAPIFRVPYPRQPNLVAISDDGQLLATVDPAYHQIVLVATSDGESTGDVLSARKPLRNIYFVKAGDRPAILFSNTADETAQVWTFDRGPSLPIDDELLLADLEVEANRQTQQHQAWVATWRSLRQRSPQWFEPTISQQLAELDANANACSMAGDYALANRLLAEANLLDRDPQPIRERKIRSLFYRAQIQPPISVAEFDALARDVSDDIDVQAYDAQLKFANGEFESAVELARQVLEKLQKGQQSRHYKLSQWLRTSGVMYALSGQNSAALELLTAWWSESGQLNQAGESTPLFLYCSLLLTENKPAEHEKVREALAARGADMVVPGEAAMILNAFLLADFPADKLTGYQQYAEALIARHRQWGKGDEPADYYERLLSVRINNPQSDLLRTVFGPELLAVAVGDQRNGDQVTATKRFFKAQKLIQGQEPKLPIADADKMCRWWLAKAWLDDVKSKLQLASAPELLQQAVAYRNSSQFEDADELFDAAIQVGGPSAEVCYQRGLCKLMQRDFQHAFEDGWRTLLDQGCPLVWMELGVVSAMEMEAQGQPEPLQRVRSEFDRRIESEQSDQAARGFFGRALISILRRDFVAADDSLGEYLARSGKSAQGIRTGYTVRAALRAQLGRWQSALSDLEQAEKMPIEVVPSSGIIPLLMSDHRHVKTQVLAEMGDFKSANLILNDLVSEVPLNALYRFERAMIRVELQDFAKAREDLQTVRQQWGLHLQVAPLEAIVRARFPNRDEYQKFVADLLAQYSTIQDPSQATVVADCCLLADIANEDFDRLQNLASIAIQGKSLMDYRELNFEQLVLVGKVLFRTQRYADANETFEFAGQKFPDEFAKRIKLFSAMALYHVSPQDPRCRQWLQEFDARLDHFRKLPDAQLQEVQVIWPENSAQSILYAEARRLIGPK